MHSLFFANLALLSLGLQFTCRSSLISILTQCRSYLFLTVISSQQVQRTDSSLEVRQLGCIRAGWPVDKSALLNDPYDNEWNHPDQHSHCFCSLEGLFNVDWDRSVQSAAHSGADFCPNDPVKLPHSIGDQSGFEMMRRMYGMNLPETHPNDGTVVEHDEDGLNEPTHTRRMIWRSETPFSDRIVDPAGNLETLKKRTNDLKIPARDFRVIISFDN